MWDVLRCLPRQICCGNYCIEGEVRAVIYLNIDGKEVKGYKGQTILDIARENGIDIPTLCHDERVKPYGACGLCVVETANQSNLLRSCATEAQDGMVIFTRSPRVEAARTTTLELLLSDHSGDCRPPCVGACPAETDCQGYVGLIANGQINEAVALIKEKLPLPASIGLVCPHPCETACRRNLVEDPVAIAALKAFAGCYDLNEGKPIRAQQTAASGYKIAIVGSGPAGLTAAYFLTLRGHQVKIFEAMPETGGMLRYGIPEYRLPKSILDQEINLIKAMGVEILTDTRIGRDINLDYLQEQYDAVFLGIGAWSSTAIGCKGEDTPGVIGGIDFLRQVALKRPVFIGKRVAIIGGGNTAMDAARTAVRLGAAEVMVIYRRTRAEMPAEDIEIKEAEEEGVIFKFLAAPLEILAEGERVSAIKVQKMQLGEPDSSGRRSPVPIAGEEEIIPVDTVIAAIGQQVNASGLPGVSLDRWGNMQVDESSMMTNLGGVFAGGDAVTGPKIAIQAVAQGHRAADAIHNFLNGTPNQQNTQFRVEKVAEREDYADCPKQERVALYHANPQQRRSNFQPVTHLYSMEEAMREAQRCLECGCADYFECKLLAYANDYKVKPHRWNGEKHRVVKIKDHPLINREPEKCILCGLCVRVCDEVVGPAALGLVHRGFETVVLPEFGLDLQQTKCISCGQCVAVCPTGALTEKTYIKKPVPLQTRTTVSRCSWCSLSCSILAETRGDQIIRVLPSQGEMLCSRGRFVWQELEQNRVNQPMIRENGSWKEVSWEQAWEFIAYSRQRLESQGQLEPTAVLASPEMTQEELLLIAKLARSGLHSSLLGSCSNYFLSGVQAWWPQDMVLNHAEELLHTDYILMLGSFNESQVAAMKARQAAQNGAVLVTINPAQTLVSDCASVSICTDQHPHILEEILAAVIKIKGISQEVFQQLPEWLQTSEYLENLSVSPLAQELASGYCQSSRAMVLVDGYSVSDAAMQLSLALALISGHWGSPRDGVIIAAAGANWFGAWQAGYRYGSGLLNEISQGNYKSLFIFGEDPVGAGIINRSDLDNCELLVVAATQMHATAQAAHLILPLASGLESSGSYVSGSGEIRRIKAIRPPASGIANQQWLADLYQFLQTADFHSRQGIMEPFYSRKQEKLPNLWDQPIIIDFCHPQHHLRCFVKRFQKWGINS